MCHGKDISSSVDITQGREVLPGNVKPTNYAVELEPNFETFKYDGTVVIEYDPRFLMVFRVFRLIALVNIAWT